MNHLSDFMRTANYDKQNIFFLQYIKNTYFIVAPVDLKCFLVRNGNTLVNFLLERQKKNSLPCLEVCPEFKLKEQWLYLEVSV